MNIDSNEEKLEFQILDWDEYQHKEEIQDPENDDKEIIKKTYIIRLFGKTKNQESVYLEIVDFKPYFYIEIDEKWTPNIINTFIDNVKRSVPKENVEGLIKIEPVKKCRFYGFTNYKKFTFLQLKFDNIDAMRSYDRALKKYYTIPFISKKTIKVKIYESNLSPMLRLMHICKMNAVGKIAIKKNKLSKNTFYTTCNDFNYKTSWKNIEAIEEHIIEKFIILSFDIECKSIDGSFPQADREFDNIFQIAMTLSRYGEEDCYEKHLLSLGETADIDGVIVHSYESEIDLLLGFSKLLRKLNPDIVTGYNIFGFDWKYIKGRVDKLKNLLLEKKKNKEANNFANNFEKLSRIKDEICTWDYKGKMLASSAMGENILYFYKMTGRVQIDLMKVVQRDYKLSSYKLDYVAANFIRDNIISISQIESSPNKKNTYNIKKTCDECINSLEKITDNKYIIRGSNINKLKIGDKIIIIINNNNLTFSYNNDEIFKIVETDKEKMTIYGNFNDDDLNKFMKNKKSSNEKKPQKDILMYWQKIDIKKSENKYKILCKSTFGLVLDNYITLGYFDGAVEDKYDGGRKFKVLELDKNSIVISGNLDTSEFMDFDTENNKFISKKGISTFWTQAKDDISIHEMFKMADGTPEDRATIGRYCCQDAALCNKLIAKLQIITNNVGMANVCHVPLSYLFLRGQGIKIFSLVAKKCREKSHLIPVLKKPQKIEDIKGDNKNKDSKNKDSNNKYIDNKDETDLEKHVRMLNTKGREEIDEIEDDGYEGAIVFPPITGVYYKPITVLDFSSLYPNAMRLRNLSHECFVDNEYYDNLPGYKYHTITYKNNNGTETTCRFAEKKDGTKGIIPEILSDLLTARKKYKKLMENESDPFKKSVLDGLQQAYKITANSLYGQTGARTSDIRMKEIAASTTATGREMLQYSKYFIENIYSKLLNFINNDNNKYYKFIKELYKVFPTEINDNDIKIHVNTEENEIIPENKFFKKEIGYEINYNFEDNVKTIFDWNMMVDKLFDLSPTSRINFIYNLKNNTNEIFLNYEKLWNELGINNHKNLKNIILDPINNLSTDSRELLFNNLDVAIDELGFKNKEHMFEKFYETMSKMLKNYSVDTKVIYGDTDSVFFSANIKDLETGEILTNELSLNMCIRLGIWASILICTILPSPMAQEYEKVLWPFVIQGKKRYVGNLYEKNPKKFKQKSMGIELKRRDNAPIVKTVSAGIIKKIVDERNPEGAYDFMKDILEKIIYGKFKMDKFIITKTLKGNAMTKEERIIDAKKPKDQRPYVNRASIVHAVLADRIADRDSGNKPLSNDRIPYAYIELNYNPELQGERVETPEYIIEKNLKLDYLFYITNQIMIPALKFLDLIINNAKNLFEDYIIREENRKRRQLPLSSYGEQKINDIFDNDDDTTDIITNNNICKKIKKPQKSKTLKPIISEEIWFDDL